MIQRVSKTLLVLILAAAAPSSQVQSGNGLSDTDQEIISLAVNGAILSATTLLIDSTAPICAGRTAGVCIRYDFLDGDISNRDLPDAALLRERLLARNQTPLKFGVVDVGLERISRDRIDAMFRPGRYGWRDLQRAHPGVRYLMQVSAPAYSSDGNSAIVWVESFCDGRCGGGSLLLFQRKSGRWMQTRSIINWIG